MKSHRHLKQWVKKFSILLVALVVFIGTSISVFANSGAIDTPTTMFSESALESSPDDSNEFKVYTEQIDDQLATLKANPTFSTAQKEAAEEKATLLKALLTGKIAVQPRNSSCINYVPFYPQTTNYYCGPASIQQTMGHYYYSPMPTQSSIYSDTQNSELSKMVEYLNQKLNPDQTPGYICFQAWWNHSTKNMQTTITTIASCGTPIIAHITVEAGSQYVGRTSYTDTRHWPYTTNGHYLSISGYHNNGDQIEVTDPFILDTLAGQNDSRYDGGKYIIDFDILDATCDRLIL